MDDAQLLELRHIPVGIEVYGSVKIILVIEFISVPPLDVHLITGSGSTPNPALVNENVIAAVLGIDQVKVLYGTENTANLGQAANMAFTFNSKDALLTYTTPKPSVEEPSAGYIFTWDMLGNGSWMTTDAFEGEPGTHSEFVEGLMATGMKKTCDDLAIYLSGCVQ